MAPSGSKALASLKTGLDAMERLLAPNTILEGRFRIVEPIGHSEGTAAYLATDQDENDDLVLVWESQTMFRLRQKPEAALRYARQDDHHFLFLRLEGQDLGLVYAAAGVVDEGWAAFWMSQVCEGIGIWHSRTDEYLVCLEAGDLRLGDLKLTVNGRAILPSRNLLAQPLPEVVPGQSLRFSAPEKELGQRPSVRSDVYALGAALYCLVTGSLPPDPGALAEGQAELIPPRKIQRRISGRTEKVILKAMSLDPGRRQPSAVQLGFALERCVPRRLRRHQIGAY